MSHSAHNRSFWRWLFPGNHLHWYWQPKQTRENAPKTPKTTNKLALLWKNTQTKPKSAVPIAPVRTAHMCAYDCYSCDTQDWTVLIIFPLMLQTITTVTWYWTSWSFLLLLLSKFKQWKKFFLLQAVRHFALRLPLGIAVSLEKIMVMITLACIVHCAACSHTTASVSSVISVVIF